MRNISKQNLAVLALGLVVGTAAAALPPGYTWGIANCGPAHTASAAACHLCCATGQRTGAIDSIERDGCDQMCDEANFTRNGFWQFFWSGYRPFNF